MMGDKSSCTHHAIAEGECCRVDRCDHGTVHVTLGALTLRLSAVQLADLAATLERAAEAIHAGPERRLSRLLC
jgi:hypothetical protein